MEEHRNKIEQGRFFSYEQKSIKNDPSTPLATKATYYLYEAVSNYGQDYLKAGLIFLGIQFVFLMAVYPFVLHTGINPLADSFPFTIKQIFAPFYIYRDHYQEYSIGIKLLASLHSLLNISVITLFLLAVRRRFKLD
jgi:hypothetical protein